MADTSTFSCDVKVTKVDDRLGVIFGFAIVSHEDGEPYYDLQGDFLTEECVLKAALRFADSERRGEENHEGTAVGDVPFIFPLVSDVAKSMDIQSSRSGLMIGFRPHDPRILKGFMDGEYTGFSIGGRILASSEPEDDEEEFDDGDE